MDEELGSTVDGELDDPLLRALARAPSISFDEPRLSPGAVVAQSYVVHRVLGAGGMGVVYEATDLVLSRRVAIKLHEIGRSDRAARLWREGRAMARLSHPNAVAVYEVGIDGSRGFIAMELIEGTNARAWARAAPRGWREIVDVYRQAAQGLAAAHRVGIVHRDFKPDNVLVGSDGRVCVADFGLALELDSTRPEPHVSAGEEVEATRTGTVMGTPAYMAPEQARGRAADARSDQYSFCVALHEALHGVRPAGAPAAPVATVAGATRPPAWLDAALARGLSEDPDLRYLDMPALMQAIDPRPRARRRVLWTSAVGAGLVGALLLRTGSWLAGNDERPAPCSDAGADIDATWPPDAADTLRAALRDRPAALTEATMAVLSPGFDAWAQGWRAAARDACEATHVEGVQSAERLDQRVDCLERARRRFSAAIALYDRGDVDAMVNAPAVVSSLPDVAMCARPDAALETDVVVPARAELHEGLRAALDRAAAEVAAARLVDAKATLDELVPRLAAEGMTRSLAEARRLRGDVLREMGRRTEATAELGDALSLALRGTDRDALATTMIALARAAGRVASGHDEAKRLLLGARSLGEALGWSPARRLELDLVELEVEFFTERYDEVERLGRMLLDADAAMDDAGRVRVLSLLAVTLQRRSRFAEALAAHDEALAFVERARGPQHPQVAMVLGNRAVTLDRLSRHDEGAATLARALAIRTEVYGAQAPTVGDVHRQIGDNATAAGAHAEAAVHYERALAIHRAADDETGTYLDLANLARVREIQGDLAAAAALMDEALPLAERTFGPSSPQLARLLVNRSTARYAAGELATGTAELERALAILAAAQPGNEVELGVPRLGLARFYAALGRHDEAVALFDAGARAMVASLPGDHRLAVTLALERARLLDRTGPPAAAMLQWQAAMDMAERDLAEDDAVRIGVHEALSERRARVVAPRRRAGVAGAGGLR